MAGNLFETVKQSVTAREAAKWYGIEVRRNGMACCPFHEDRHPSMKLDHRFHCFGCGADGDVIDFTARLYGLSSLEAAQKLAQDFGLAYDSQVPPKRNGVRQKSEAQKWKEEWKRCYRVLADYAHLLQSWETDYAPRTLEEELHPRFVEAVQKKGYTEYLLDLFLYGGREEQKQWMEGHREEIANLERRITTMVEKPTNKERLKELNEKIEEGIREVFSSDKYAEYLKVMSRFPTYSVNNQMLIRLQRPSATRVAGYSKWQQFERHVKRGEHGITIIAPTPYKKKIEEQKLDPDTKAPMLDANGKVVMEEKEIEIPMFRPTKVFDYAQTEGKPLPQLAADLFGNVRHYEAFMEALRRTSPVPMTLEPMQESMDGFFSPSGQRIAIRQGMSEVQTVCACIHEMTHATLHNYEKQRIEAAAGDATQEPPKPKSHQIEEIEAESTSYMVCQYFGIETGANSFGYVAAYCKDRELSELRACLNTINKTAGRMIADIDRHFAEVCKEQGIDLSRQEKEPEQTAPERAMPPVSKEPAGVLSYYAAECMEFPSLGEYYGNLSLDEAIRIYREIPAQRMNGIKGIGFELKDGSDYEGSFPILSGQTIDLDTIRTVDYYRDNPLVQQAVRDLIGAMPEMEVLGLEEGLDAARDSDSDSPLSGQGDSPSPDISQEAFLLPGAPEQALDEYPMPDSSLSVSDMQGYGYLSDGILPVSRERALELDADGITVYRIYGDNTESMVFDAEEIMEHSGLFGVDHEEWERSPQFHEKVQERLEHQQERERAFLAYGGDCFAIYQVSQEDPQDVRFMNLDWLESHGLPVERDHYDLVYTGSLEGKGSTDEKLESLYERFNIRHPADYCSPSLSVSDIVALKQDGRVSCHYCDSVGFREIPGFLPDNPLKNAELSIEDDYGMIDGILNNGPKATVDELEAWTRSGQPISLMDLADAAHREEQEKKKSVVGQLRQSPKQERKKTTAPKRSAGREL